MDTTDLGFEYVMPDVPPRPRSRLVCLKPMGMGTGRVEGLASYIVRLAMAHSVSPKRLVRTAFAAVEPEIADVVEHGNFFTWGGRGINGRGPYARLFCQAATALTCAEDLQFLTLLPLQHLLPENGKGLVARPPQWCPSCIADMAASGQEAFRPLAWSFKLYRYCSIHRRSMLDRCPECGKLQHFLPRYPSLEHCSHCQAWLGGREDPGIDLTPAEKWVSLAIEDIVSNLHALEASATRERFLDALDAAIQACTDGKRVRFCKETGLEVMALKGWFKKRRPSFPQWLVVSYGLGIWPSQFFSGREGAAIGRTQLRQRPETLRSRRPRPQLSKAEQEMVKGELARIAADPVNVIALSAVARRLGLDMGTLKYWAPEECRRIRDRYAVAMRIQGACRRTRDIQMVERLVRGFAEKGEYPRVAKVNLELRKLGRSLVQPDMRRAYRESISRYYGNR